MVLNPTFNQQYVSYIVSVRFIGDENRNINLQSVTGSVSDFSSGAIYWKDVFCTRVVQVSV